MPLPMLCRVISTAILLGKGHETYVEIEGVKHHFSEHEVVREIAEDIRAGRRKMEHMTL